MTAINARMKEAVEPKNNACVLLCQACQTLPETNAAFFQKLGVEPPRSDRPFLGYFGAAIDDGDLSDEQRVRILEQLETGTSRPWRRRDFPRIAQWLDQNEGPLRLVHAAASRETYVAPLIGGQGREGPDPLIAVLTPIASQARHAARVLCLRAMMRLGEDEHKGAWEDLLASHRLGRLISQGPTAVEALAGYAIERVSHDATRVFLRVAPLTARQAKECRDALDAMPPIARIRDKVDVTERCVCLDALLVMAWNREEAIALLDVEPRLAATGRMVSRFWPSSADWDVALRNANSWYDRMVTALGLPTYSQREAALNRLLRELSARAVFRNIEPDTAKSTKVIGDVVAARLLPKLARARIVEDRTRQAARNLKIALALTAFHADHARYPAQVADLTPNYVAEIPPDLFTGQEPIYRRLESGYLLYSVGEDGRDEGGRIDDSDVDDLSIRMPEKR